MGAQIVVAGSCNTDLSSYASRLPTEGETITGHKFVIGFGGKGANQSVTAAKLGAEVALIGKLGDDTFGKEYKSNLKRNKVICDFIKVEKGASTGVAAINVADNGANSIVIVPGANNLITTTDVEEAEELISQAKVVVCQNEIPQEISLAAICLANKHKVTTIYNPAPAQEDLNPLLFNTPDYFCPNETEAQLLTGTPVKSIEDAKAACNILTTVKGCKSVIITLGENGAVYQAEKGAEVVHIPTIAVNAVDTTGAGDAFIGSFAYFLSMRPEMPVADMIKRAGEIAAISVQKLGTQSSFPMASELPPHIME